MNAVLSHPALARRPQQQRAHDRFNSVLGEAEKLLLETGLAGFSIPDLATRLGYTRASIYKFFPTPFAILNELARRHFAQLEKQLSHEAQRLVNLDWKEAIARVVHLGAEFYNANPVAQLLLLGGPQTDDSYRAKEMTIQRLGNVARMLFESRGVVLPQAPPDITALAVDFGTTAFRLSFFLHGKILNEYRDEAVHAMLAYLDRYIPASIAASVPQSPPAASIQK